MLVAPGISNLQSKPVHYLHLDECWIYPLGRMAEAEARVGDYLRDQRSKILRISQAGAAEFRLTRRLRLVSRMAHLMDIPLGNQNDYARQKKPT